MSKKERQKLEDFSNNLSGECLTLEKEYKKAQNIDKEKDEATMMENFKFETGTVFFREAYSAGKQETTITKLNPETLNVRGRMHEERVTTTIKKGLPTSPHHHLFLEEAINAKEAIKARDSTPSYFDTKHIMIFKD